MHPDRCLTPAHSARLRDKALIRGRSGRSTEDSFTQLRAISQAEHRKLAEVAQHIVDEAVRRARARHNPT